MRPDVFSILATLAIATASGASAQQWKTLRVPNDGFSVSMPANPTTTENGFDAKGMVRVHQHLVDLNSRAFIVQAILLLHPVRSSVADDEAMRRAVEAVKGKCEIRDQHTIAIKGGVAREVLVDKCGTGLIAKHRIYLIGDWIYMIGASGPAGTETHPDTSKFLDSFKLIPIAGAAASAPNGASAPALNRESLCTAAVKNGPAKVVNMMEVANILRGGDFKKREFETTAEYTKRSTEQQQLAQVRQLITDSGNPELVFLVPIPQDKMKYDADRNVMTIGGKYSRILSDDLTGGAVVLSYSQTTTGTYEGVNAFGVKKEIERISARKLKVTIPKSSQGFMNMREVNVTIPRDEAKDAKDNLAILFAGKLTSPFFSTGLSRLAPKIDFPYDYTTIEETIHVSISCASLYNRATGKIILQLDPTKI